MADLMRRITDLADLADRLVDRLGDRLVDRLFGLPEVRSPDVG
ncbi:hypothetical protein [Actinomadura chokoriensis]